MYSGGDFFESYYEHGCSIIQEKDVLVLDLKGNSWSVAFKRWWYNLFLLSYTNRMSRIYCHSSHAMKGERARHFRRNRDCIHPLSVFKTFWDAFILHVIILHKIIFHHTSSLLAAELSLFFYFFAVVLEIIIIFDIYVNLRCGYIDKTTKKIIVDGRKAFMHYCSTKLFFHVVSAIPMHALMLLRYGMDVGCLKVCKSNAFMCTLVILNSFSLIRFIEASAYWHRERRSFAVTCLLRFVRIFVVALLTTFQFLSFIDTLTLITFMHGKYVNPLAYFSLVVFVKHNVPHFSNFKLFSYSAARVFKTLLIFHVGFLSRVYHLDRLCSLVAYFLSHVFYLWGVIEVFSCISRAKFTEDQKINNKSSTETLARARRLPDKICLKLRQYFDFNMTNPRLVEKHNGLYKSLPYILKKEIKMHSYSRVIMKIPYFSEWPMKVHEALVVLIEEEIFLSQDVVAESGVPGEGLYVLEVGVMAVYTSDNTEMGHMIDGDFFGELSLVTDKEIRTSYVVAVTDCKILILEKNAFRQFMREYPDLFYELKKKLHTKYSNVVVRSDASNSAKVKTPLK